MDGEGRNGVYTAALLDHVKTAGITIEQMFKRVRVSVEDRTNTGEGHYLFKFSRQVLK